ncbi:MAG: DUF2029 domain-containing protein [Polyangiaceae bacterium]|nr:DUF2029 domain-containing protein [Polyangiaceae bacterium]
MLLEQYAETRASAGLPSSRSARVIALLDNVYVALGLFAAATCASWFASLRHGYDAIYPYLLAYGVREGAPIYDAAWRADHVPSLTGLYAPPEGVFYTPSTGLVALPLAWLPFHFARHAMVLTLVAFTVVGVFAVFELGRSRASWRTRMVVSALVVLASASRWCMTFVQGAPIIAGLLAVTLWALHNRRFALAIAISAFAIPLKVTLAVPFLFLLFLYRQYAGLALVGLAAFSSNVIGFARVGGYDAYEKYRAGLVHLGRVGEINSPNPWDPAGRPRTDWNYLFTGLSIGPAHAQEIGLVLTLLVGVALAVACLRVKAQPSLATACCVSMVSICLSLVSVYHHHYDLDLLYVPLLLSALMYPDAKLHRRWALWAFVPVSLIMIGLPVDVARRALLAPLGDTGPGYMNLAFPIAVTLALAGALSTLLLLVKSGPVSPELENG